MSIQTLLKLNRLQLWHKIVLGLVLGIITGLILKEKATIFAPLGVMFINAISMIVIPIIFFSIVCSVMSVSDVSTMGRLTVKALLLYLITMSIATTIGLGLASIIKPGASLSQAQVQSSFQNNSFAKQMITHSEQTTLVETIVSIIPSNPISAMANGQILPTIFFALLLGFAIITVGKKAKPVADFFDASMQIMFKIVNFILYFAPIGVFALIAQVVGTVGIDVVKELALLIVTIYIGCIIHAVVVYSGILGLCKLNPLVFFKKMIAPMAFAFSTGSSAATLPLNLQTTQKKIGVSAGITDFILPLGTTMNMNGLSVYLGVAALFVANIFGVELTLWQYAIIIFTSTLASIGAAGVPMAGVIVMSIVLNSIGLPIEAIALIASVDRIIEMMTTTINVTGDSVTAVAVAKSENQLNEKIYYGKN